MAKKKKFNIQTVVKGAIRRSFVRSPVIQGILKKHRKEETEYKKDGTPSKRKAVYYQCNKCKEWYRKKYISVDHIDPVIPVDKGFTSWDDFVERLFVSEDRLQVLCKTCHNKKTQEERKLRKKI
jgi:5-methylcytosine-specific restriction endonuclease McrA